MLQQGESDTKSFHCWWSVIMRASIDISSQTLCISSSDAPCGCPVHPLIHANIMEHAGHPQGASLLFASRGSFQFDLFAFFVAAGAACFNQFAPGVVDERAVDVILGGHVQAGEAAEAFLVFVDAPHLFSRFQDFGDGAKIEVGAAPGVCPFNTAIL